MVIHGRCHCGNVAFELSWEPSPAEIPARACTCSFCTAHGGVWTSHPDASLVVTVADASLVSRHAFDTRTADFHVCARCGVVPVATCELAGRVHAVVNVNTFVDVDPSLLRRTSHSLDGETLDARLARRARNWIGRVQLATSSTSSPK